MSISPETERKIEEQVQELAQRNPDRALRRAHDVYEEAVQYKRLSKQYQAKTKIAFKTFKAFKEALEAMGIEVIIETSFKPPSPQGGPSDHSSEIISEV